MTSLRSRLTMAVMIPLLALAITFGGITCWMIERSSALTWNRILIGSVRILGRALTVEDGLREQLIPLAVHLMQRRSAPETHYSIWDGECLIAGEPELKPPPQYDQRTGRISRTLPGVIFPHTFRNTPLVKGYVDSRDAVGVLQPAYLRDGILNGKPVRVATEIRQLSAGDRPVVVQVADYVHDLHAYQQSYFLRVLGGGILIAMIAVLLFYWAITWGLRPFASLAKQIDTARHEPSTQLRLKLYEKAPREAQMLAESFNSLLTRVEGAVDSLSQFTLNASHQMRTPLAIMRVHLDVLERYGANSERGMAALEEIGNAVVSLERLLVQLITLARIDEQGIPADSSFDLFMVVSELVADRIHMEDMSLDIGFEADGDKAIHAQGHSILAGEMVANLVDNAIRYNRPGGSVTVRVLRRGSSARVEVEDDGPGISPEDRPRIFERFYRAPAASNSSGSGLGLSIVKSLAERMGATVQIAEGLNGCGVLASIDFVAVIPENSNVPPFEQPPMTAC